MHLTYLFKDKMLRFSLFRNRLYSTNLSKFIPKHEPVNLEDLNNLQNFLKNSNKLLVLTGAGVSTESGIPDYRSEAVGLYARSNHKPVQYLEFLRSELIRQRYWARNFVGWTNFSKREPNEVHKYIRMLEVDKKLSFLVTQNVDSLHYKAGSEKVIELHGSAFRVVCLTCNNLYSRQYIQQKLLELNPNIKNTANMIRPDGDVEIPLETVNNFKQAFCDHCKGVLKPDIVFFGDNVPKQRVEKVKDEVSNSDALLVLGSSLSVFSGFRIVLQAIEERKPVCIVNIGPTRADSYATLKISAKCGDIVSKLCKL